MCTHTPSFIIKQSHVLIIFLKKCQPIPKKKKIVECVPMQRGRGARGGAGGTLSS